MRHITAFHNPYFSFLLFYIFVLEMMTCNVTTGGPTAHVGLCDAGCFLLSPNTFLNCFWTLLWLMDEQSNSFFFEAVLILHVPVSITLLNIRPICQFRQMCVGMFVHIFFRQRWKIIDLSALILNSGISFWWQNAILFSLATHNGWISSAFEWSLPFHFNNFSSNDSIICSWW